MSPEEETIDFQKERQQILQTVQDEFPPILKMMERANVRLLGTFVVGKESQDIYNMSNLGFKKETVSNF